MKPNVELPPALWVLLAAVLLGQGTWLFLDARKRGAAAWFWGIWGLIQFPMPLLCYWLIVRLGIFRRRRKDK